MHRTRRTRLRQIPWQTMFRLRRSELDIAYLFPPCRYDVWGRRNRHSVRIFLQSTGGCDEVRMQKTQRLGSVSTGVEGARADSRPCNQLCSLCIKAPRSIWFQPSTTWLSLTIKKDDPSSVSFFPVAAKPR